MAKCSDNRKRRKKRDKEYLQKMALKYYTDQILRENGGANPDYHDIILYSVRTGIYKGRRYIKGVRAKCVKNLKFKLLLEELIEKCRGITVELPAELFQESN